MDASAIKKGVKRQEISSGIFMEKYQETEGDKSYYYIKIEVQIFNQLDFRVDFTESKNVVLEDSTDLVKQTRIEPFTKVTVAKLLLETNWNLKTKFKFSMQLPSIETQLKHMTPVKEAINTEMNKTMQLGKLDTGFMDEKALVQTLEQNNWQFIDHEFPPTDASVMENPNEIQTRHECLIHWRRAKYIVFSPEESKTASAVPYILYEGIHTSDIKQGKLNDSWLLSAMSVVAQIPGLVTRIILTKEPNNYGIYKIKLCRMGSWKTLTLDDHFPCYPLGEPIFAKNQSKEIWVLLLEKAFAKLYGGYHALENGNIKHALIDLTGCPTFTLPTSQHDETDPFDPNQLWQKLKHSNEQRYLLSIGTKEITSQNAIAGLVKEQAYSILRVVECDPGVKILNVLNPWGAFEWTGDWSKKSPLWTEELKQTIKPDWESKNSTFWISYKDFLESFESINICMIKGWNEFRAKGKFINCESGSDSDIQYFCSRWYYHVKVPQKSKVIIGLHQENEKELGVKITRPNVDIGLSLLSKDNGTYRLVRYLDTEFTRECFMDVDLDTGEYYIVPRSLGIGLCVQDVNENAAKVYALDRVEMRSVIKDIFEKYDISSRGVLNFEELKALYNFIDKELTQAQYQELLKDFGRRRNNSAEWDGVPESGFVRLFSGIFSKSDTQEVHKILLKLGYTRNLFSYRTRVFRLTLHSDVAVEVSTLDGLKDNIDHVANKLLIRKHGRNVHENNEAKLAESEVYGLYYFNR